MLLVLLVNLESHISDKCAVHKSTFQVCSSWTCVSSTYKYIGAEAEIDFLLLAAFALYSVQYTPTLCHADSSPIIYIFLIIWCSETDLSFKCCVCKYINCIFCLKIDSATAQYLRIYVSGTIEAPPLPLPPTTPSPGAGQEGRWPMQWTTVAGAGAGAGYHQGSLKAAGAPSSCCCCPSAICTFVPSQQSRAVAAAPHWRLLRPPPNASFALAKVLLLPTFTNTVILIKVTRIAPIKSSVKMTNGKVVSFLALVMKSRKITGENPEVCSDIKKPRDEREE